MLAVDRHDRRDLRGGVPAVGDPAHPLQPARQAGERAPPRSQPARARAAGAARRRASSGWASIRRRCCAAWKPPPTQFVHVGRVARHVDDPPPSRRRADDHDARPRRSRRSSRSRSCPDLVLMGGAMVLLLWAAWRPDSDAASARRRHREHRARRASRSSPCVWYCRRGYDGGPGPDRGRQLPLGAPTSSSCSATIFAIALAHRRQRARRASTTAESHVLILLASSGMMLLAAARDLMIVFLGIELMSIAVYVLAGHQPAQRALGRRRAQVLPARRLLDGIPAVRHRARVRRHRARRTSR